MIPTHWRTDMSSGSVANSPSRSTALFWAIPRTLTRCPYAARSCSSLSTSRVAWRVSSSIRRVRWRRLTSMSFTTTWDAEALSVVD